MLFIGYSNKWRPKGFTTKCQELMWTEYFILCSVMLAFYAVIKISCGWLPKPLYPPEKPSNMVGHGIDSSTLASRIEQVRYDYSAELPPHSNEFKRRLRVDACRQVFRQQPFLHRDTEVELTAEPEPTQT
jgi:hypothetical protein